MATLISVAPSNKIEARGNLLKSLKGFQSSTYHHVPCAVCAVQGLDLLFISLTD